MSEVQEKLLKKRSCVKGQLTIYKNYLETIQQINVKKLSNQQISELKLRLRKLDTNMANFDSIQTEIEMSDSSSEQLAEREAIENIFFSLMSTTQSIIDEANSLSSKRQSFANNSSENTCSFDNSTGSKITLPTIKLPTFDGCYNKWLEYRDTFHSLIHSNESINTINKYHYLRSSLEGGAALVIKSIDFCSDNYDAAWDLLCARYNNNKLLINNHIKALFSVENIVKESDTSLRFIIDHVTKNLKALENLGLPVKHWDALIIHLVVTKLDSFTCRKWEEHKGSLGDIPVLDEFYKFLRNRADFLETVKSNRSTKNEKVSSFVASNQISKCILCKNSHRLHECPSFVSMSLDDRNKFVSQNKLCINCLNAGHYATNCRFSPCKTCKYKHNTLLHRPKAHIPSAVVSHNSSQALVTQVHSEIHSADMNASEQKPVSLSASTLPGRTVLLSTALVRVVNNKNGEVNVVRALLDSGSQLTMINECLRAKLGLNSVKNEQPFTVLGIGNTKLSITDSCHFVMQSIKGNFSVRVSCMVVPEITKCLLPNMNVDQNNLNIPKRILVDLADPQFFLPADVDILIGADLYWEIISGNQIKLGSGKPVLQQSRLGWLVSGPIDTQGYKENIMSCKFSMDLSNQLQKFWEIEEIPSTNISKGYGKGTEEDFCENHFVKNTYRLENGRFCVKFPFHTSPESLGDSLKLAKQRFYNLEKRFGKQPALKEQYKAFIKEYQELGHLSSSSRTDVAYYLPHHPVLREKSETTKLRVVFDASAKTSTGRSLNDIQGVGAVVQSDLFSILLRFRRHSFVVTADIEKMYRQILIHKDQRHWQMIIWRENSFEPLQYLQLNTVTYGTASAPFLSTRCLYQLAQECDNKKVGKVIRDDFYVDDLLTGMDSESDLEQICKLVVNYLSTAGFNLRKFRTNSNVIFQRNSVSENQSFSDSKTMTATLGLIWSPESDNFMFPVDIDIKKNVTKRIMLSTIAKIFDPLGLLSIYIVKAKFILQHLWKSKCNWDDIITGDIEIMWLSFIKTMQSLSCIKVARHVCCKNVRLIELHIFSDASQAAYGACAYIRSVDANGKVYVKLLCAKSRIAPIKTQTIPRLELCGALQSAELGMKIRQALQGKGITRTVHWTDSMVVLGWIHTSEVKKLNVFVANRVNKIKDLTKNCEWRYVPTGDNPADLVSRGVDSNNEKLSSLWWGGPEFLTQEESYWPSKTYNSHREYIDRELNVMVVECQVENKIIDFSRYSKLSKLKRIIGYVLRFINMCRKSQGKENLLNLTADELNNSMVTLVKLAQRESFSNELESIKNKQSISKKSNILSLNPYIDNLGILRVGGRIHNSKFSYDKKHPMLLDSKHHLSTLIFESEHIRLMHAGPQLLLASVRDNYWVVNARILARRIPNKCVVCRRFNCKTLQPLMGNLPHQRLTPGIPFETTGVDFAGPFYITDRKGRGCKITKCYLCVFVCFTTKALHLEAVSDLSKEAFILTLKRFISRRGKPKYIFCDNGTNFVGTKNELDKFINSNRDSIVQFSSDEGVVFKFSPAYAPHFGGLWEAGVKSAKFHIKRVLGDRHLTFEELATLFAQVEAILNSRPLCPMSSNPNDLCPLSPGHFIIGKPLTSLPSHQLSNINPNRLDRYNQLEQMRQHFWSRWHHEYVAELQHRTKWKQHHSDLKIGDMVIVKEENSPPLKWRIGRIHTLFPGPDGISRVADVQTSNGIIRRSLNHLCPLLPPEEEELKKNSPTGEDVHA